MDASEGQNCVISFSLKLIPYMYVECFVEVSNVQVEIFVNVGAFERFESGDDFAVVGVGIAGDALAECGQAVEEGLGFCCAVHLHCYV